MILKKLFIKKKKNINQLAFLILICSLISCSSSDVQIIKKIHTELQDEFLIDNYNNIYRYAVGEEELSRPNPIELSWEEKKEGESHYIVKISENDNFDNPIIVETNKLSTSIYNLKIGTKYYWRVDTTFENETYMNYSGEFVTENVAPRNLYVDGITNVRDIGGWSIDRNHRVKQGLLYRSGRLNLSDSPAIIKEVTDEGEKVLLEDLKIKSEMDLRLVDNNEVGAITSSVLGDSVTYYSCPMEWNNNNLLLYNREMIKHIFSDILSKEENYPLIFHCNIGTDRTGIIAYMLNGLLGVEEEDLYYDYLFSNFGLIGGLRTISNIKNNYIVTIDSEKGNTLSEKIYNALLKIGVTNDEIETIKNIFVEAI